MVQKSGFLENAYADATGKIVITSLMVKKNMKKLMSSFVAALAMVAVGGCSGGGSKLPADIEKDQSSANSEKSPSLTVIEMSLSPAEIAKNIYSQMQEGNYGRFVDLLFANTDVESIDKVQLNLAQVKPLMTAALEREGKERGGLKSVEILEEKFAEDGKTATVTLKTIEGNSTEKTTTVKFVKKVDGWKITQ
ncbi:hypothetical protein AGMMS49525_06800 [Bacteroidia bacterium]|nr:hypothetical protein AGMMS49525_06800 [Bacteroidia bacterium]